MDYPPPMLGDLPNVINLHFLQACNYHCKHCFIPKGTKELDLASIKRIVDSIRAYFDQFHISNGRINLVGGEPLLSRNIDEIIDYIYSQHILVSIQTNGYLLTEPFLEKHKGQICTIGLSVDSLDPATNRKIGRCTQQGVTLDKQGVLEKYRMIQNYGVSLKINVCVQKLNCEEDFEDLFTQATPERIKILQMIIIDSVNEHAQCDTCTKYEFNQFVRRHLRHNIVMQNAEQMMNACVMIDTAGNLISDTCGKRRIVGNTLRESFSELIKRNDLDINKFSRKYRNVE